VQSRISVPSSHTATIYILFLFFFLFSFLLTSLQDLFFFYLVVEGLSFFIIFSFVLTFNAKSSISAALHYFSLNAFVSAALLISIVLLFSISGTANYEQIITFLSGCYCNDLPGVATVSSLLPASCWLSGLFFIFSSFFKLTLFPASVFLPNLYEKLDYFNILLFGTLFKAVFFFV
jgi:formate hydrogenlyase subunit 3/multisubunit Na+/H+ antiporter MnhD subunit